MKYEKLSLNEVKKIQLSILDEIKEFCDRNSIRYFLFAGTLLGAIRHKGYIPWDDDIDLCMLRSDYERFAVTYKGKTTYLLSYAQNDAYYYPIIKVCKEGTLAKEECLYAQNLGINIDIFPIDNIPNDDEECKKYFNSVEKHRRLLARKVNMNSKPSSILKRMAQKIYNLMTFYESKEKALELINFKAQTYNTQNTQKCCSVVWGIGIGEAVSCEVFSDVVEVDFEGKKYTAPIGYKTWLTRRYGDYMKLPPIEKQISNHVREDYILENT